MDSCEYPSDEVLDLIEKWPVSEIKDRKNLLSFCQKAWSYPDYVDYKDGIYTFRTGGWSGNESILAFMEKNQIFWALCWKSSHRGGLYEFEL